MLIYSIFQKIPCLDQIIISRIWNLMRWPRKSRRSSYPASSSVCIRYVISVLFVSFNMKEWKIQNGEQNVEISVLKKKRTLTNAWVWVGRRICFNYIHGGKVKYKQRTESLLRARKSISCKVANSRYNFVTSNLLFFSFPPLLSAKIHVDVMLTSRLGNFLQIEQQKKLHQKILLNFVVVVIDGNLKMCAFCSCLVSFESAIHAGRCSHLDLSWTHLYT